MNMAAAYDVAIRRGLATVTMEDDDAGRRLERLRIATTQAASKLPVVKRQAPAQAGGRHTHEAAVRGPHQRLPPADARGADTRMTRRLAEHAETTIAATSPTRWETSSWQTAMATHTRWRG